MIDYKIKPWTHQQRAIERGVRLPNFALFFEMGTGKTSTTINILRHKVERMGCMMRIIVFAPPIVLKNWRDEFVAHSNLKASDITILYGSAKKRVELFLATKNKVIITNYESLLMPELFEQFLLWNPEGLVWDESQKLKSYNSKRSKLAYQLSLKARHRYILSGTPVLNSPMDLFQQYKILDLGETFGENFFGFRHRYFYDKNAGMPAQKHFPDWQIQKGAVEEINKLIQATSMRVLKEQCLDLPPLVRQTIRVEMTPEQRKAYDTLKKDFITFIGDNAASAPLAIVKALRLMQVTSGFLPLDLTDDEGVRAKHRFKDTPKMAALKELLEELSPRHKILVWAVWKDNYEEIRQTCAEIGIKSVEAHGAISLAKKMEAVEAFNSDPDTRVFIGHPGSLGIGINLTSASYSIFYSRTFSLEHSEQAESRNHRGGSKEAGHTKITRIDLVCDNSIDEEVVKALHDKAQISVSLLKGMNL